MKLNKPIQILLAVLLGLAATFIILEVSLRILGAVYVKTTAPPEQEVLTDVPDHFSILCVGASWTSGVGAPSGRGYPEQLEEVLGENRPDKTFTVFRRAVVSQNTAQVLERLPAEIEKTDPDMVVILVGVANSWNHWGFVRFGKGGKVVITTSDNIERIRTYKLAKILASDVAEISRQRSYREQREREENLIYRGRLNDSRGANSFLSYGVGCQFLQRKNLDKAEEHFLQGIEENPDNSANYTGMGFVNMSRGTFDEAVEWFKQVIDRRPEMYRTYGEIGFAYFRQGIYDKAVEWFEKALEIEPESAARGAWYGGYMTLSVCYERSGEKEKAEEARKLANKMGDVHRIAQALVPELRAEDFRNWIIADFREMVTLCKEKGIEVIMQTFPNNAYDKYNIGVNRAIREAALELGVPFVDHERLFTEYFIREGKDRDGYFEFPGNDGYQTGEGHCNELGYRLMAENIYNVMEEREVLEKVRAKK